MEAASKDSLHPLLGVVIPTYNEQDNIAPLMTALGQWGGMHIVFVDDGSTDGTRQQIREWQDTDPSRVTLINRGHKFGLATAYLTGFRYLLDHSPVAWIAQMDADGSHRPADLQRLWEQAQRGYDLVIGSRYVPGGRTVNWSPLRQLLSQSGSWYSRTILGCRVQDITGGFKVWHRSVLQRLPLEVVRSHGFGFQIEMTYLAYLSGARITETPITFYERATGQSKMSWRITVEALRLVWVLRWHQAQLLHDIHGPRRIQTGSVSGIDK